MVWNHCKIEVPIWDCQNLSIVAGGLRGPIVKSKFESSFFFLKKLEKDKNVMLPGIESATTFWSEILCSTIELSRQIDSDSKT